MASRPPSRDLRVDAQPITPDTVSAAGGSRPHSREALLPGSRPASRPSTRDGGGRLLRAQAKEPGGGKGVLVTFATAAQQPAHAESRGAARGAQTPTLARSTVVFKTRNPDEALRQLTHAKEVADAQGIALRTSMDQVYAMMDDHNKEKPNILELRSTRPSALEQLDGAWLQVADPDLTRKVMDEEADKQGVAKFEDEYNVLARCKFKYNPFFEQERYLPAIGRRALLTFRGTAVEILGDHSNLELRDQWQRRLRKQYAYITCGPMERPKLQAVAKGGDLAGLGRYMTGHKQSGLTSLGGAAQGLGSR